MTGKPAAFKQADVPRALKAGMAAGVPVVAYELTVDGTLRVFAEGAIPVPQPDKANSWDDA